MGVSWRESGGLWELLRYIIPGLMTILYVFIFLFPLILLDSQASGFYFEQFVKNNFSVIVLLMTMITLPIGYIVYEICLAFKYKKFLEKRGGVYVIEYFYKSMNEIENPFQWNKELWEKNKFAIMNEIMDVIFNREEAKLGSAISRAVMVYMSTLAIIVYAPIVALVLSAISVICLDYSNFNISYCDILYYVVILGLIVGLYCLIKQRIIGNNGFLKKTLDELEIDTLLQREFEIKNIIRKRAKFEKRDS